LASKFTPKQLRFIDAYTLEPNGAKAARSAKFAHPRQAAARLLANANIAKEIRRRASKRSNGSIAGRNRRMKKLTDIMENPESQKAACQAIEILNKMDGIYVQRHEVTARLSRLSDEDLDARIAALEGGDG
jgi:phage terminase small subunit